MYVLVEEGRERLATPRKANLLCGKVSDLRERTFKMAATQLKSDKPTSP